MVYTDYLLLYHNREAQELGYELTLQLYSPDTLALDALGQVEVNDIYLRKMGFGQHLLEETNLSAKSAVLRRKRVASKQEEPANWGHEPKSERQEGRDGREGEKQVPM